MQTQQNPSTDHDSNNEYLDEEWVRVDFGIPTKKCHYEISNYGRIKSIDKITGKERALRGAQARGGLLMLNQKLKDGSTGIVYIHRFVAEQFVEPESDDHKYILHKDYDKGNNKWTNLIWAKENDWKTHQRSNPNRKLKENAKNYKLTEGQVRMMKKLLKRGKAKRRVIAKEFGVTENCAYKIEKGTRWAHVDIETDDSDIDMEQVLKIESQQG